MARESRRKRAESRYGRPELLADLLACSGPGDVIPARWIDPAKWSGFGPAWLGAYKGMVAGVPVVRVDNVARHFFEHPESRWDFARDFPNSAPPFPTFFVEYSKERAAGGQAAMPLTWLADRIGWLFDYQSAPAPSTRSDLERVGAWDPAARWHAMATPIAHAGGRPVAMGATVVLPVLEDGSISRPPALLMADVPGGTGKAEVEALILGHYGPALLAISFMHCKNVTLAGVEPDRALNRERRKAGLEPFVRYSSIVIDPLGGRPRVDGSPGGDGSGQAMHIARGHFARYSKNGPLFGRLVGTFWKPAHARGSAKQGVVVSDYSVEPGE